MELSVGIIAHSCGVSEPRGLSRDHVRMIEGGGITRPLADIYPVPAVRAEYAGKTRKVIEETRETH